MAGRRDRATRYEICARAIDYLSNEETIANAFKETPWCCSPVGGWDRLFFNTLNSQFSSEKFKVPGNICQHCLDSFINPTPEVRLLQTQQALLEEELSNLVGTLQGYSKEQNVNIPQTRQFEALEELSEQIINWIRAAYNAYKLLGEQLEFFLVELPLYEPSLVIFHVVFWTPLSYLLLLDEIHSISTRRRPPPRRGRRTCTSVSNPRPQPSILSENLSRFAVSVCQSSRPLAL